MHPIWLLFWKRLKVPLILKSFVFGIFNIFTKMILSMIMPIKMIKSKTSLNNSIHINFENSLVKYQYHFSKLSLFKKLSEEDIIYSENLHRNPLENSWSAHLTVRHESKNELEVVSKFWAPQCHSSSCDMWNSLINQLSWCTVAEKKQNALNI